jgi:hypothetical protein
MLKLMLWFGAPLVSPEREGKLLGWPFTEFYTHALLPAGVEDRGKGVAEDR